MLKILKKINKIMDGRQKRQMFGLVIMMIIGATLELASVGIMIPVVEVILSPEAISESKWASILYEILHAPSTKVFSLEMLGLMMLAFALKNIFLFIQQKSLFHFTFTNQYITSEKLMRNYISRNYEFYLNAETGVLQRSITADVANMYALILAVLQIATECITSVILVAFLFLQDPVMTITVAVLLLATVLLIKSVIKPIMRRTGKENQDFGAAVYQKIAQAIGGIKEIKVAGREEYFVNEYRMQGKGYAKAMERYQLFSTTPKLLIETVCIIGMSAYLMVLVGRGAEVENMIPMLTAFGVAAVRLLPAASRINNQLTGMNFNEPFFFNVTDNLVTETDAQHTDMSYALVAKEKLPVQKEILLTGITYHYPNSEKYIFRDAEMRIPVGASVGIVGESGAGKTTVVDILLGLLAPEKGSILADGVDTKEHYREWLLNIGYIPQMIFLLDSDIRHNVAFGVPEEEIDDARVLECLKEAQLTEFVESQPEGIFSTIGERGIRISGGQRQRIGIARALYHDPEVLILDEATSALDNDTEKAIMDSINHFMGRKTLIIIAHRLQTIEKCDMVYRVENGKILQETRKALG